MTPHWGTPGCIDCRLVDVVDEGGFRIDVWIHDETSMVLVYSEHQNASIMLIRLSWGEAVTPFPEVGAPSTELLTRVALHALRDPLERLAEI